MIPEVPGFYKVFLPAGFELRIAEKTVANEKCYSKKEQMEKEYLENIWKPLKEAGALNDGIIYIGKGINIRNRLKLYKRVMFNGGTNHSGGVYICQIVGCEKLEVEWYAHCSDVVDRFMSLPKNERNIRTSLGKAVDEELRKEEHRMIKEYCDTHNGLKPFANRES